MSEREIPEPEIEPPAPGEFYRIAWTFYLVLATLGVVWVGLGPGLEIGVFVDPERWWRDVLYGVGSGLVLVGAWQFLRRVFRAMRELEEVMAQMIGPLSSSEVFALALISGFSEELFFRGAMQSSLGWIWTTLIFALVHTGPGKVFRVWTVFALVAGLCFAGVTLESGNILGAFIAHFLVNWINLSALVKKPE